MPFPGWEYGLGIASIKDEVTKRWLINTFNDKTPERPRRAVETKETP